MTTVEEHLEVPGGDPAADVVVTVFLAGEDGAAIAEAYGPDGTLIQDLSITTGDEGDWTADLHPNADIVPAGTVWARVFTERGEQSTAYFDVPASGTHDLVDLLTDPPGALTPSGLAAHAALRGPGGHLPDGSPGTGHVPTWDGDETVWTAVPGSAGSLSYTHTQATPSLVWTVQHNLGYRPAGIYAVDGITGDRIFGVINYVSANVLTITYLEAHQGTAYVS